MDDVLELLEGEYFGSELQVLAQLLLEFLVRDEAR